MGEDEVLVVVDLAGFESLLRLFGTMALQDRHCLGVDGNRSATPIVLRH
jgi:hypothetical protein